LSEELNVGTMKLQMNLVVSLAVIILALSAIFSILTLTKAPSVPSYSTGNRWTWQVTRSELDPFTENVTSTASYQQTLEYLGEQSKDGHTCAVFRLTSDQTSSFDLLFRVVGNGEIREFGSESYSDNTKTAEYRYSAPLLFRKFPMEVGARVSDASQVSGHDNEGGAENIDMFETRVIEVVGKETLLSPAKLECFKLRIRGTSSGQMFVGSLPSEVTISYDENVWYSPEVKETVKSTTHTTTVVVTQLATSVTVIQEERTLLSYG